MVDLVRQRAFGLVCGYADCNDAKALRQDPAQKLLLARDPLTGQGLADPSTLSRFENRIGSGDLYRLALERMDVVIEQHRKRRPGRHVKQITIDLDPTQDSTPGGQQLALFNGYYDSWCYLHLLAFLTFDQEPEQQLVAAILRRGSGSGDSGGCFAVAPLGPPASSSLFPALVFASVSTADSRARRSLDFSSKSSLSTSWRSGGIPCSPVEPSR